MIQSKKAKIQLSFYKSIVDRDRAAMVICGNGEVKYRV
jgi:hypothetical protein